MDKQPFFSPDIDAFLRANGVPVVWALHPRGFDYRNCTPAAALHTCAYLRSEGWPHTIICCMLPNATGWGFNFSPEDPGICAMLRRIKWTPVG